MNQTLKESARDWIRIVEDVSSAGVSELKNPHTLSLLQGVQLDLLFRAYWLGDLDFRIHCADTWNENARREIRQMVRENVFSSAFSPLETRESRETAHRFLGLCEKDNLYRREGMFSKLLGLVLELEDASAPAAAAGKTMESRMMHHIFERRRINHNTFGWPKRPSPDDPPPGMDEFEYIDWLMSH